MYSLRRVGANCKVKGMWQCLFWFIHIRTCCDTRCQIFGQQSLFLKYRKTIGTNYEI